MKFPHLKAKATATAADHHGEWDGDPLLQKAHTSLSLIAAPFWRAG